MDAKEFYAKGVQAARAGDRQVARDLIARAVKADPGLVQGWWALAHLVDDQQKKIFCLRQVLKIDPAHEKARALVNKLEQKPRSAPQQVVPDQLVQPRRESIAQRSYAPQDVPTPSEQQAQPSLDPSKKPSRRLWIGVISALSLLFVGVALTFLIVAGVINNPFTRSEADYSNVVLPTLPAAWTTTPTETPEPVSDSTPEVQQGTPLPVEQPEYSDEVENALDLMHKDRLDAALDAWNAILIEDPQDHFSLAMRAHTRLRLVRGETSLTKNVNFSLEAIADADKAIEIHPNMDGDYYLARAYGFENLSRATENRVDQDRLVNLALENMLIGITLPHTDPTGYYGPPNFLLRLGRCDEALEQGLELLAARGEDAAPVPVLHYNRANAHFCRGEYDEAIEQIDLAIDVLPSCSYRFIRALILYHSGDVEGALNEINYTIDVCPSFSGTRYYLRALIHYERGNYSQASQDLLLGSFNTWARGGLKAYVEALLALENGDRALAIESMKYAEQTMDRTHGPFIERIQADLAALGVSPDMITPDPSPAATPIPALPEGHPTPPPETYVKYTTGTGPFRLEPGEIQYFHFFAPRGFEYERVSNLKAHLIGGNEGFPTDIELLLHNPSMAYWQSINLIWGANEIRSEGDYVNTSGDINIRLWNAGVEPVVMENFGITIKVVTSGGSNVQYSYLDKE